MYKVVCKIKDLKFNYNKQSLIDEVDLPEEKNLFLQYSRLIKTAIIASSHINKTDFPKLQIKPFEIVVSELTMSTEVEIVRFYNEAHNIEHSLWLLVDKR